MAGSGIDRGRNRIRVGGLAASASTTLAIALAVGWAAVIGAQPAQAAETVGWRPPPMVQSRIDQVRARAIEDAGARIRSNTQASRRSTPVAREGSFVSYRGRAFRIVGGAPWYVTTWKIYGRPRPYKKVTESQFSQLADYPADGTFVQTAQDRRVYRMVGGSPLYVSTWAAFGGRAQRSLLVDQTTLDRAHLDEFPYTVISPAPLDLAVTADGRLALDTKLFVRGGQTGRVYQLLGGSLRYLASWAPYGGPKPAITVDQATIDRAGEPTGPFRFVRRYPVNNWLVTLPRSGELFVMAGGAPIYVATPSVAHTWLEGLVAAKVDETVLADLRAVPEDNSMLTGLPVLPSDAAQLEGLTVKSYKVVSGVPLLQRTGEFLDILSNYDGENMSLVDQVAIDRAGQGGVFDHLLAPSPN